MEETLDAQMDLLPAPQREEVPRGLDTPDISSFSFPPSVNLFLNSVTLLGHDWVEGLRNLSLSGSSGPLRHRPCFCLFDEEA